MFSSSFHRDYIVGRVPLSTESLFLNFRPGKDNLKGPCVAKHPCLYFSYSRSPDCFHRFQGQSIKKRTSLRFTKNGWRKRSSISFRLWKDRSSISCKPTGNATFSSRPSGGRETRLRGRLKTSSRPSTSAGSTTPTITWEGNRRSPAGKRTGAGSISSWESRTTSSIL